MRWTVQLSLYLKHPQASRLAERMAPWVLHHAQATNSMRLVRLVAAEWSEDRNLAAHAHDLLVAASLDQQIGGRVRKSMGTWVNQDGASAALLRTLARAFATLTPAHVQMLGRLGDLARSAKEGVTDAVGGAISDLWSDEDFRPRLRDTLGAWFGRSRSLREAAASAFLYVALQRDPDGRPTLLRELQIPSPDWIVRGWRTVLEARLPVPLADRAFIIARRRGRRGYLYGVGDCYPRDAVHNTPADELRGQRIGTSAA